MRELDNILVAHPLQQHSYRTAEALQKSNKLSNYVTTIYYNPKKTFYKILSFFLNKDSRIRLKRRVNDKINDKVITKASLLGLVYLLLIRVDKKKIIEPYFYTFLVYFFGRRVLKIIRRTNPNAVIMYDTTATSVFYAIKRRNMKIVTILDMTSTPGFKIRDILDEEIRKKYAIDGSINNKLKSFSRKKIEKYNQEIFNSDYILVPSDFVKNSVLELGVLENKLIFLPFGVDTTTFYAKQAKTDSMNVNFMYAGRMEYPKGLHYLISAFKELEKYPVNLNLIGPDYINVNSLIDGYKNITYHGPKRRDEMGLFYQANDIYMMCSLFEGFSLTIFEALSSGLPVIATKNSGAEKIIQDGKEGFVINAASKEEIIDKVLWIVNNRDKLKKMSNEASNLSKTYTWNLYNERLINAINSMVNCR